MQSELKQDIRERILTLLRNHNEEERKVKSLAISEKLFRLDEFQRAETVLFYASFDGEVNTFEMIQKAHKIGKKIALPTIIQEKKHLIPTVINDVEDDLEEGPFGILQCKSDKGTQIPLEELDLVVVPGVAFDQSNNRLGRGGGYYDRFLEKLPQKTPSVGLAFDFQIVETLHCDKYDLPVSCVITN